MSLIIVKVMPQNLKRFDGVERVVHNNYKRHINKVMTVSNLNRRQA